MERSYLYVITELENQGDKRNISVFLTKDKDKAEKVFNSRELNKIKFAMKNNSNCENLFCYSKTKNNKFSLSIEKTGYQYSLSLLQFLVSDICLSEERDWYLQITRYFISEINQFGKDSNFFLANLTSSSKERINKISDKVYILGTKNVYKTNLYSHIITLYVEIEDIKEEWISISNNKILKAIKEFNLV